MKFLKRCSVVFLAMMVCACAAFALTACQSRNYGVYRYKASFTEHYDGVLSEELLVRLEDKGSVGANIELEPDNAFSMSSSLYYKTLEEDLEDAVQSASLNVVKGTYVIDGETITLTTESGKVYEGTFKNKTITMKIFSDVEAVEFVLDED